MYHHVKCVIFLPCQLCLSFNFKNCYRNIWIVRLSPTLAKRLLLLLKCFSAGENTYSSTIFASRNCSCVSEEAERVINAWKPWSFPPKTTLHEHFACVLCCWHPLFWDTRPTQKHSPPRSFLWCPWAGSTIPMLSLMSERWILSHYKPVGCGQQDFHLWSAHGWIGADEGPFKRDFLWMDTI